MFYLVLQNDGGFWIDANVPNEAYVEFQQWEDAYKTGMAHRQKFENPKRKSNKGNL